MIMKQRQPQTPPCALARRLAVRSMAGVLSLSLIAPPAVLAQSAPSAQAAHNRFRGTPVTVNFVNADIEAVTRAMAAILKQQFVVDPR
jgi:general secretion pathway protein D